MSSLDAHRASRHAKKRQLKRLLRFAPRRAAFHRYPLVGRFAAAARRRASLWSFKSVHVRPAFYIGSVLSLLPVMGIQLPLAFLLSLVTRTNVMVTGALQFITNPLTAAPVYYATYRVGKFVLKKSGFISTSADTESFSGQIDWTSSFGTTVVALFVGGTLCGLLLGGLFDLLYLTGVRMERQKLRACCPTGDLL